MRADRLLNVSSKKGCVVVTDEFVIVVFFQRVMSDEFAIGVFF